MSQVLATISFRANLLDHCKQYAANAKQIIKRWAELFKATSSLSLDEELSDLLQSARLSGLVTAVETLLNDTLADVFVAYPPKLGKKQVTILELNESGSTVSTIKRVARKVVSDLSYATFADYLVEWQKHVTQLSSITEDQIMAFAEVKATRDLYVHSDGKPNEIYKRKAGPKVRSPKRNGRMPLDEPYINEASRLAEDLVCAISTEVSSRYVHCTKESVFREMWDATCCGKSVPFDDQWDVSSPPYHRKDLKWGWSSSEKALYDIFLRIFHGESKDITTNIPYALYRWSEDSEEGTVIRSWLEHPFYL